MIYPNMIYNACQLSINMLEEIWKKVVEENMQNEQFVLDWLDTINSISVRN